MARRVQERDLALNTFVDPTPPLAEAGRDIKKIVILVPGIRTNAEWIDSAATDLKTFSDPIEGFKSFGGRISSMHLITRIGLTSIRDDVRAQVNKIKIDHPSADISLLCHSMGTDIIFDIIESIDFNFNYIFFIGAICRTDKAQKIRRRCKTFINHVGVRDPWPILAALIRPDKYSSVGTFGFNRTTFVNDIRFDNNHETCTFTDHVFSFIIPVILGLEPLYPRNVRAVFNYSLPYYIRNIFYASIIAAIIAMIIGWHYGTKAIYILPFIIFPVVIVVCTLLYYMKARNGAREID